MFITLSIYIFSIITTLIIREKCIKDDKDIKLEIVSVFGFILLVNLFLFLTYHPVRKPIFYDYNKNVYGINQK